MSETEDDTDLAGVVHWSPREGPFAGSFLRLPHLSTGPAAALGLMAVGALALGALAIGALAIGALAIGRLAVGRANLGDVKIGRLEVEDLVVRRRNGRPF